MTRRPALLALVAFLAPAAARAQPTTLVYLDGANAPAPLVRKIDERLRALLDERGIALVDLPAAATGPEGRITQARKDLDAGISAWKLLSLETAQSSLAAAESGAIAAAEFPQAAAILAEARLHLGLVALAVGKNADADRVFRKVAIADPDRRLDVRSFPPDVIAAYEKSRKAIAAAPPCELTLSAEPASAALYVDGRTAGAPVVKLPCGEHLIAAAAEGGTSGEKVDLTEPKTARALRVAPDPARIASSARAAAKKGDETMLARALDALAAAAGAERVLAWDLRSVNGRVESPMRLRDRETRGPMMRTAIADLASSAAPDPALRSAITSLLTGVPQAAPEATAVSSSSRAKRRAGRNGIAGWIWWTAGGVAVLAAGGAAAALAQPSDGAGGDSVSVTVEK